jgi:hypothetical protein
LLRINELPVHAAIIDRLGRFILYSGNICRS